MDDKKRVPEPGDIVQITNPLHPWYPCLLVVDEVKSWGVQAYVSIPRSNSNRDVGDAYNTLVSTDFEIVGVAQVVAVYGEQDD